jgi:fructose-bisphosphate aldolase, class I
MLSDWGMPLIVWSYPRGSFVDSKGGKDSFYALDYAARTASELGADVVKVNFLHPEKQSGVPPDYMRDVPPQQAIDAVVRSADRTLLLVSGGNGLVMSPCSRRPGSRWKPVRPG